MIGLWGKHFEYFQMMSFSCLGPVWKSGTYVSDLNISINLAAISQSNSIDQLSRTDRAVIFGNALCFDIETKDKYIYGLIYIYCYMWDSIFRRCFKWDSKIAGQRRAIFLAYKEVKNMHQNSLMFAKDLFFAAETM